MSELALRLIAENKAKHARGEDARVLDLGNCGLKELPKEIRDLIWLKKLKLYDNVIEDLQGLEFLTKLEELDLSYALLCKYNFKNDETLEVVLVSLEPLKNLTNLQRLDLHGNQKNVVGTLEYIVNLPNLEYLDVRDLGLVSCEQLIPLIKTGTYITSDRNPWQTPPPEIVEQGNAAILHYFEELNKKQQFKNTEIKLILLGNSTAGKTSLSRYLSERIYQTSQPSTHGIDNKIWQPEGRDLQVNIWDFGGQEYYHATHRLFLSRNAVYVIVWDIRTSQGGVEPTEIQYENDSDIYTVQLEHFPQDWWVKNIRHFTRESNPPVPILLVQNKCLRDDIKRLSGEFEKSPFNLHAAWLDNHIDIEATAAHLADPQPHTKKWQRSFEDFEEKLLDKLQSQLTHYEFATYHREIRNKIRELAANGNTVLSYENFEKLCYEIESDANMDLVEIYLRDITGDILYFDKNELLKYRVFLKPNWVCECIYRILSRRVQEQNGLFDLDWVCEALRCSESEALDFLALMREFGLIFDDNGNSTNNFIAPQYLSETCTKPEELLAVKKYANLSHAFTLWFPDFLPKSYIARFVAYWGSQAQQRLFWKNGLLFKTNGCTTLVERIDEGKIQIDIQSGEKDKMETATRRIFQFFLQLEDGRPGFAVSFNREDFVWWGDVQEALQIKARQVKTLVYEGKKNVVDLQQFMIFQNKTSDKLKLFISYSRHDEQHKETLLKHLSPLRGKIITWHDHDILPGEDWDKGIKANLREADVVLFLVTHYSLATEYIQNVEMPIIEQLCEAKECILVPIIVDFCAWEELDFAKRNALPEKGIEVTNKHWTNENEAWVNVVNGVQRILAKWQEQRAN